MRRSRVPVAEKRSTESKTKYNLSLRKTTSMGPKRTKRNFSVSMVNTRSNAENKTKDGAKEKQTEPAIEIDLETPDQSVDEVEKKATETTPMPKAEEPNPKPMEFSPIDTVEETTGNTPKNVFYGKIGHNGRNEVERRSSGRTESRERQNIWDSSHENDRHRPK